MPAPAAAATATKGASVAAKGAQAANVASAVGEVGATAISAISQINDANKRRKFEQNFQQLTLEQQKGLDMMVLRAKSQSERLGILSQYLTQLNAQRIQNLSNFYSDKEKSKRTNLLLIGGGILVVGVIVTILVLKRR